MLYLNRINDKICMVSSKDVHMHVNTQDPWYEYMVLDFDVNSTVTIWFKDFQINYLKLSGICKIMGRALNFIVGYTQREKISKPCLHIWIWDNGPTYLRVKR